MTDYPVLIHIPHSSIYIPEEIKKDFLISEQELQNELLVMTDWYTQDLFSVRGFETMVNSYSRLVFDPERFRDDKQEVMAQKGMGVVYTRTSEGKLLRKLTNWKREEILKQFYDPYHREFEAKTEKILTEHGRCLIIDGHSFSSLPLPYEESQDINRPDFCIGIDNFHNTPGIARYLWEYLFWYVECKVEINKPFSGAIVPPKYLNRDKRVTSVMIEINRSLYLDEQTGVKSIQYNQLKSTLQDLIKSVCQYFLEIST